MGRYVVKRICLGCGLSVGIAHDMILQSMCSLCDGESVVSDQLFREALEAFVIEGADYLQSTLPSCCIPAIH